MIIGLCSPILCAGRPFSHISTGGSSGRSSVSDERGQLADDYEVDPDDVVLKQCTAVVKTVMELSNKVPISRPSDYVDLVKVRGDEERREREREREREQKRESSMGNYSSMLYLTSESFRSEVACHDSLLLVQT